MGLVEHPVRAPPERELLGRLDHPQLLAVLVDRVELRVLEEHVGGLRELARREVPVGGDALAVVAALLQALQHPFEEVDLRALLDLALVGIRAVGVLEVEVVVGLGRPPAPDEVAIEAGMEPNRRELVRRQEHRERPLRRREEESREVDDVHRVREPDAGEAIVGEVRLQRLRAGLMPLEREAVEGRGRRTARRWPSGRGGAGPTGRPGCAASRSAPRRRSPAAPASPPYRGPRPRGASRARPGSGSRGRGSRSTGRAPAAAREGRGRAERRRASRASFRFLAETLYRPVTTGLPALSVLTC